MKGSRRRVLGCVATAAAGAVMLVSAATASAQKPEKVGDGVKTGQLGVQLFNYGGFISNGGGLGPNPPALNISPGCTTSTSSECRWERLERLFAYLASKGVTNVELFGHANFPANSDTANLVRYRALLHKYGLHAGGWHGDMSEANWDARIAAAKILGADYLGSGGSRTRASAATPTRWRPPRRSTASASARSRPVSAPRTTTTTRTSSPSSTSTTAS
jgi:hypothetical protein